MGRATEERTARQTSAPGTRTVCGIECRRLNHLAVLLAVLLSIAAEPHALPELYKPPNQRPVAAKIIHGVLLAEGSISLSSGGKKSAPAVTGLFVVDTAATTTILSPATARALGGKGTAGEKLPDTTLKLAGAQVSHRPAAVYNLEAFEKETGQPVIGIAGADVFENFGARIDYTNSTLTLIVLQTCATPDEHLRVKVIKGLPFVEATLETPQGRQVRGIFLLDTGQAGDGLVLTSEFLKAHPELDPSHGPGTPGSPLHLAGVSLGSRHLKDVAATVAPPTGPGVGADLAGVVGGGILRHFNVTIDLPASWLLLTPPTVLPSDHYAAPSGSDAH